MNYIDEILDTDSEINKGQGTGCGCSKCRSKEKKHPQHCSCSKCISKRDEMEEEEFLGWFGDKFDDIASSLKRAFACNIVDLTAKARPKSKARGDGKNTVNTARTPRNINRIDAVVLHQMAFSRGSNLNKYLRVGSHYIIMPDGQIGQLYPFSTYVNASNSFNRRSVAVEFAGNFPNTRGKCWKSAKFGCHSLTQPQIDAGRCLLSHLKSKLPSMQYVFAHRQSSNTRSNDPGPDIWKNIAEWGIKKLGYDPASRSHVEPRAGRPIPADWI